MYESWMENEIGNIILNVTAIWRETKGKLKHNSAKE